MAELKLEPWAEAIDTLPLAGSVEERCRAAVGCAILAPSSHNAQPWLFQLTHDRIDLYADRSRALPVADPEDRELIISCGAALHHLRLALAMAGLGAETVLLPDPDDPDLLARVTVSGTHDPDDLERDLGRQIARRHTNRRPFEPRPVPGTLLEGLGAAAREEGAWLEVVRGEGERALLADLIAAADRRQLADRRFRRELAAWTRSNVSRRRDGIPGYGMGFGAVVSVGAPLVLRTFDVGEGRAARDRELALGSPCLAVLGNASDAPADLLRAGQALSRILLLARAGDVQASFLNQPIEVEDYRREVEELIGREGRVQLILRMGFGPTVAGTPRRGLDEVLLS